MPERLHKSCTNKVFAGVCGGIAEYFNVDPTLIRLAWAMAFFVGGTGFILYILALALH
ncbi:MAG: phage shock protein PspC [Peptococcaceae bacterium]|jgi:phage shock protein PspC (stress-responsive transcriptional regulator)|nr:phage shock protein PspC [Peptococcaceae bacterium]